MVIPGSKEVVGIVEIFSISRNPIGSARLFLQQKQQKASEKRKRLSSPPHPINSTVKYRVLINRPKISTTKMIVKQIVRSTFANLRKLSCSFNDRNIPFPYQLEPIHYLSIIFQQRSTMLGESSLKRSNTNDT